MHKAFKGALIGGAVGAGAAAFQASRQQTDSAEQPGSSAVAKGALQGAAVGGLLGFLMDRRARRARGGRHDRSQGEAVRRGGPSQRWRAWSPTCRISTRRFDRR